MTSLKKMLLLTTLLLLPYAGHAKSTTAPKSDQTIDGIAAIVNESIITEGELSKKINTITKQFTMAGKPLPPKNVMRKKILDDMINKAIQLQIADRADLQIDREELDAGLEQMARQNHVTVEKMRKQLESEGISYKEFRNEMRTQLRLQKLQSSSVGHKVSVTDEEVQEFLKKAGQNIGNKQYHIADILIALPEAPTSNQVQNAQAKAKVVLKKLDKKSSFEQVANQFSDSEITLAGNDMGWRKIAEIPDLFLDTLKTMKKDDIRGPLRAPNGLHIIKLVDVKSDGQAPNPMQIKAMLYNRKMNEKVHEWIEEMRDGAYVKIIS